MKKHKEELGIFIIFFILISGVIFNNYLNNLDELWIFNMAKNVANGLLPYKDFNLITTPGIPLFCGMLLKIFGTELIVMRVLTVILGATIFLFLYKILKLFKINKYVNLLLLLGYYGFVISYITIDYNYMNLLISLILVYLELKDFRVTNDLFNHKIKRDFFIGILAGLSIWFKQTTGIFLSLCFIGYKILAVRNKDEFKIFLKIAITRFLGVIIPVICLFLYLYCNNLIGDFVNYAIIRSF